MLLVLTQWPSYVSHELKIIMQLIYRWYLTFQSKVKSDGKLGFAARYAPHSEEVPYKFYRWMDSVGGLATSFASSLN